MIWGCVGLCTVKARAIKSIALEDPPLVMGSVNRMHTIIGRIGTKWLVVSRQCFVEETGSRVGRLLRAS